MIDEFFCGTAVKEPAFSMRANAYNVYLFHFTKMNNTVFNILIIQNKFVVISNEIKLGKFIHVVKCQLFVFF